MKLTDEERQIVEDNYGLVDGYMRDRNLDEEEWSGFLAIELCLAVMKHNPKKSKLSTYFYMRCDSRMKTEFIKTQSQKRFNNGICELKDDVSKCQYSEDVAEEFILLDGLLKGEHGEIVKLRYDGYTQSEIADELGVSQAYVSNVFQKIREEFGYDKEM